MRARRWMVYCLRRQIWWRPEQAGYTEEMAEAGKYTDTEALAIVERMNYAPSGDCQVKLVPVNHHWLGGGAPLPRRDK